MAKGYHKPSFAPASPPELTERELVFDRRGGLNILAFSPTDDWWLVYYLDMNGLDTFGHRRYYNKERSALNQERSPHQTARMIRGSLPDTSLGKGQR